MLAARRRKKSIQNLAIFVGLLLIAFIAKMEAINFLLALPVAIVATVYVWRWQDSVFAKAHEIADRSPSWILNLICGFTLNYLYLYLPIPIAAGMASGFLTYSALNKLFITP